jgi:hypothetical protein
MHRLRVGHFMQKKHWEVVGMPIVAVEGVHAVLPVVLFTQPDDLYSAKEWSCTTIDYSSFRFVHGLEKKAGLIPGSDLESLLLAGEEGVTWLYYDEPCQQWRKVPIGIGELTQFERTGFKGSGDVSVGRIGDDPFAYVVAVEPFHGNTVSVYCKDGDGHPGEVHWRRVVLDVYGDPNEKGEGTAHHVVCADFDQDARTSSWSPCASEPWQGVFYYKAIDARKAIFTKWRVSSESAARIAVADFTGNGKPRFRHHRLFGRALLPGKGTEDHVVPQRYALTGSRRSRP